MNFAPAERLRAVVTDDVSLGAHLGLSAKTLQHVAHRRQSMYDEFLVFKEPYGARRVFAPNRLLRRVQARLLLRILRPLSRQLGEHVTAHRPGRSTVDAAALHLRACETCDSATRPNTAMVAHQCGRMGVKFRLQLKEFYLSTKLSWIRRYFNEEIGLGLPVSSLLARLLTTSCRDREGRERQGVPQGALTSGDICNLVADRRLDGALMKALPEWRYTRHDDLLYFSHDRSLPVGEVDQAIGKAVMVMRENGYRPSMKGTQIHASRRSQRLHGIGLNRKLNIPANQFRRMHMLLYKAKQHGFEAQLRWAKKPTVSALKAWIEGWLRYYAKVAPEKTAKLERLYLDAKNVARVGPVDPNAPS